MSFALNQQSCLDFSSLTDRALALFFLCRGQCHLSGGVSQGREVREINVGTLGLLLLLLPSFLRLLCTGSKLQQYWKVKKWWYICLHDFLFFFIFFYFYFFIFSCCGIKSFFFFFTIIDFETGYSKYSNKCFVYGNTQPFSRDHSSKYGHSKTLRTLYDCFGWSI